MPGIDKPPMSQQAQAQMGPPGGPGFGPGVGQAQEQVGKNQADIALSTVEKILMGVPDESFRPAAMRFIAQLKVAAAQSAQTGPQSSPMGQPPGGPAGPGAGGPPPPTPAPPTPGQMPG